MSRIALGIVAVGAVVTGLALRAGDGEPLTAHEKAPEFAAGSEWLNVDRPTTIAGLKGRVVVVHFWTFGCINCVHNYPAYKNWQEKFAGKDVTIVGVHTPEFASEKVLASVKQKARDNGLKFPIVIDNEGKTWQAWRNRYWPAVCLVDKQGRVRDRWEGELGQDGEASMTKRIEALLAERP